MPSLDHETTLARQWELLRNHLPSRPPGRTARVLRDRLAAAGHEVSKRTVERDLIELSLLFPIHCNDRSIPFGWHWMENARFDTLGMDLAEAVSLGLLEDVLRRIMPPAFLCALEGKFALARQKLAALPKVPHARWRDLARYLPPGMPFLPPAVDADVLAAAQEALLQRRQLEVVYHGAGAATARDHILNPLSLVQQGVRTYLVATAGRHQEPVLFALHRMTRAVVRDESAVRPKGYTLEAFLDAGGAQFGGGDEIQLRARISGDLARLLQETPISKNQRFSRRGDTHTLHATVHDSWQLSFWLLSQGSSITVLEPASLKKRIMDELKTALAEYEKAN